MLTSIVSLTLLSRGDSDPDGVGDERGIVGTDERIDQDDVDEDDMDTEGEEVTEELEVLKTHDHEKGRLADETPDPFDRLSMVPYILVDNAEPLFMQFYKSQTVLIHCQVFHRYQPLKVGSIETYLEDLECDAILVHQWHFPVSLPGVVVLPKARVSTIPSNSSGKDGMSKDCAPIPTYPANECPQLVTMTRTDTTCENEDLSLESIQIPPQRETKLQGVDSTVGQYIFESNKPLLHPPSGLHPMLGDLFIQKHSNGDMSVWLWNNTEWLPDISDGHVHPILGNYQLSICAGSDLTWVTHKTRVTYLGKEHWHNKSAGSCIPISFVLEFKLGLASSIFRFPNHGDMQLTLSNESTTCALRMNIKQMVRVVRVLGNINIG
ncbi:hypothetical protein EDD16DRAFT_1526111 [Pisolithus croceorrhizus]|nr:hypothetical protein EDD16DRAFT_1526111 [Pisolithus croceorrhizus]